jgi:hypothetical protein
MMKYLWDMKAVTTLANLEIAIYKAFPDKEEMQKYVNSLDIEIRDTYNNEEDVNAADLKKTFEHLKSYIESYEDIGYDLYAIATTSAIEDIKDDNESGDEILKKRKLSP